MTDDRTSDTGIAAILTIAAILLGSIISLPLIPDDPTLRTTAFRALGYVLAGTVVLVALLAVAREFGIRTQPKHKI